jgi:hypothetical protein
MGSIANTFWPMQEAAGADEKRMRLRYAGTCRVCGRVLPAKTEAVLEAEGPLQVDDIASIHRALASALPSA